MKDARPFEDESDWVGEGERVIFGCRRYPGGGKRERRVAPLLLLRRRPGHIRRGPGCASAEWRRPSSSHLPSQYQSVSPIDLCVADWLD